MNQRPKKLRGRNFLYGRHLSLVDEGNRTIVRYGRHLMQR